MRNDFESGYLMHWGLKKGSKKENHKYVARIDKNGKYRYFYTLEEYKAFLNGKSKDASKKIKDTKKKIEDAVNKGLKKIDKVLNKKKYDQVKKDLSTEGAREEKKNIQRAKQNSKRAKELSTISAKEKSQIKAAARKAEQEAARKAHIKELKEKGIEKKRKEKEQIEQITKKQAEKKESIEIEKRKEQKKAWLEEFRKKAKDLFCKDSKDSVKEDHTKHPEIPIKRSVLSKDQDMAAVNKGRRLYETKLKQLFRTRHDKNADSDTYNNLVQKAEGSNINCASCSIAYDLRRRGYDVTAPTQIGQGFSVNDILSCYKTIDGKTINLPKNITELSSGEISKLYKDIQRSYGVKHISASQFVISSEEEKQKKESGSKYYSFEERQIKKIEKELLESYPEGSYGILTTSWQDGGGHAQIWSIEDGDVVIRDPQINKKDTLYNRLDRSTGAFIVRTDNLELADIAYEYAMASELDGATIVKKRK